MIFHCADCPESAGERPGPSRPMKFGTDTPRAVSPRSISGALLSAELFAVSLRLFTHSAASAQMASISNSIVDICSSSGGLSSLNVVKFITRGASRLQRFPCPNGLPPGKRESPRVLFGRRPHVFLGVKTGGAYCSQRRRVEVGESRQNEFPIENATQRPPHVKNPPVSRETARTVQLT